MARIAGSCWVLGLIVGLVGCGGAPPGPRSPPGARPPPSAAAGVEHREILAVMDRFLALRGEADDARAITKFVVESHAITVAIDETAVPYLEEDLDEDAKHLLLAGFLAGNAAAQLRAGVKQDDVVAGVTGELKIYRALRAASSTRLAGKQLISPSLARLLELEAKGELRAYLARARANRKPEQGTLIRPEDVRPDPAATSGPPGAPARAARDADDAEAARLTAEGLRLLEQGRPEEAITGYFDKVIASYERRYGADKRHIYCAQGLAEAAVYAAASAAKGEDAIVLGPLWAEAWFERSYALTELHRTDEAQVALDKAIALSPRNAHYLSELGYHLQNAKDWRRARDTYKAAEDAVHLTEDRDVRRRDHTRALRGQGYCLVELGQLDAAEAKYRESLVVDPGDTKSRQELDYIKGLRAAP